MYSASATPHYVTGIMSYSPTYDTSFSLSWACTDFFIGLRTVPISVSLYTWILNIICPLLYNLTSNVFWVPRALLKGLLFDAVGLLADFAAQATSNGSTLGPVGFDETPDADSPQALPFTWKLLCWAISIRVGRACWREWLCHWFVDSSPVSMEWLRMCCKWGGCERGGGWGCCGNCPNAPPLLTDAPLMGGVAPLMGGALAKGFVAFGDGQLVADVAVWAGLALEEAHGLVCWTGAAGCEGISAI